MLVYQPSSCTVTSPPKFSKATAGLAVKFPKLEVLEEFNLHLWIKVRWFRSSKPAWIETSNLWSDWWGEITYIT